MNNSFTKRYSTVLAVHCSVYSMLRKERDKWGYSLTIAKPVKCICTMIFNSDRVTISFYIQRPNDAVNRTSVVHSWSSESGSLHV